MQNLQCDLLVTAFEKVSTPGHCVMIHDGYWQRYAMYQPYKARMKQLMHAPTWDDQPQAAPGPNDVVIHVRCVLAQEYCLDSTLPSREVGPLGHHILFPH